MCILLVCYCMSVCVNIQICPSPLHFTVDKHFRFVFCQSIDLSSDANSAQSFHNSRRIITFSVWNEAEHQARINNLGWWEGGGGVRGLILRNAGWCMWVFSLGLATQKTASVIIHESNFWRRCKCLMLFALGQRDRPVPCRVPREYKSMAMNIATPVLLNV